MIERHGIRLNPQAATITDAEVIVVAVKPQVMEDVLPAIIPMGASWPLILSVAAGKTIASFERHFGRDAAVIRTIPNTPAAVGRGITAMARNAHVSAAQMRLAQTLLAAVGEVVEVAHEGLIDAVTAVSGSGPAYVFLLAEELARAGVEAGLPAELAMTLARATVSGSGELLHRSDLDAATLRKNVTSPGGTTAAALQVLMGPGGFDELLVKAIAAATRRGRELAG